jgi:polyhydroxyalkanoate synthesis regulator phasin
LDETATSHPASKDRKPADWFRDAWAQALLAVGAAEDEAGKVLHKAGELAGWKPEEARRIAKDFGERLAAQRKELDDGISRAVSRVKFPKREEIDALGKRVGRIAERIEALEKRRKR